MSVFCIITEGETLAEWVFAEHSEKVVGLMLTWAPSVCNMFSLCLPGFSMGSLTSSCCPETRMLGELGTLSRWACGCLSLHYQHSFSQNNVGISKILTKYISRNSGQISPCGTKRNTSVSLVMWPHVWGTTSWESKPLSIWECFSPNSSCFQRQFSSTYLVFVLEMQLYVPATLPSPLWQRSATPAATLTRRKQV